MVTEKIEDAVSLVEACGPSADPLARDEILRLAGRLLAKMHRRGVLQNDLHAANFLLQGTRLIVVDPAQIRFAARPIGRKLSLRQLARLAHILLPGDLSQCAEPLYREYAQSREWPFDTPTRTELQHVYRRGRIRAIQRNLRRLLRKDKRYVRISRSGCYAVVRKDLHESVNFTALLDRLDHLVESGRILKSGPVVLVSHVTCDGRDVIVRRFDEAGLRMMLARRLSGSIARCGWIAGLRFAALGMATACPLAFVERKTGFLRQRSYLLTERITGQTLYRFLSGNAVSREQKHRVVRQLAEAIDTLTEYGFTYRDPDLSGILVSNGRLVFVGLDRLRRSRFPGWHRWRHARQVRRLVDAMRTLGLDLQESDLRTP